jgi:hypothetical protein
LDPVNSVRDVKVKDYVAAEEGFPFTAKLGYCESYQIVTYLSLLKERLVYIVQSDEEKRLVWQVNETRLESEKMI